MTEEIKTMYKKVESRGLIVKPIINYRAINLNRRNNWSVLLTLHESPLQNVTHTHTS